MRGPILADQLEQTQNAGIPVLQLDNVTWHVNFFIDKGQLKDTIIHAVVTHKKNESPLIEIMSFFPHPKVVENNSGRLFFQHGTPNLPISTILCLVRDEFNKEILVEDLSGDELVNIAQAIQKTKKASRCYQCQKTGHTYANPQPPRNPIISSQPAPRVARPPITAENAIDNPTDDWNYAFANIGFEFGKLLYEARVDKISPTTFGIWKKKEKSQICAVKVGWGTEQRTSEGVEGVFFGNGINSGHLSQKEPWKILDYQPQWGETFGEGDTITTAIDFDANEVFFAKNGKLMGDGKGVKLAKELQGKKFYPVVGLQNSCAILNFKEPKFKVATLKDFNVVHEHKKKSKGEHLWESGQQLEWTVLDMTLAEGTLDAFGPSTANKSRKHSTKTAFWARVFEFLEDHDLSSCHQTCRKWKQIIEDFRIMQKIQFRCSVTGATCIKDILAIGCSVTRSPTGEITSIHSSLNPVSWERCEDYEENRDFFLPLVLESEHGMRCHNLIVEAVSTSPQAGRVVDGLTQMMYCCIKQICETDPVNDRSTLVDVWQLYSYLHHIYLFLASQDKELQAYCLRKFTAFVKQPHTRGAAATPNLHKMILYMTLLPMKWASIRRVYMTEGFDREMSRIVFEKPELKTPVPPSQDGGEWMKRIFEAMKPHLMMLMLEVYFLVKVNRPPGLNLAGTLRGYHDRMGFVTEESLDQLIERLTAMRKVDSFAQLFEYLYCKAPREKIFAVLKDCLERGSRAPTRSGTAPQTPLHGQPGGGPTTPATGTPRRRTTPAKTPTSPMQLPVLLRNNLKHNLGISSLRPLQQQLIHHFKERDVVVTGPVSIGKTTAACISCVSSLLEPNTKRRRSRTIIMCVPSRWTGNNICNLLRRMVEGMPSIRVHNVMNPQPIKTEQGCHIVVGTAKLLNARMGGQIRARNLVACVLLESLAEQRGIANTKQLMYSIPQGIRCGIFETVSCKRTKDAIELIIGDDSRRYDIPNNKLRHWYMYTKRDDLNIKFIGALCQQLKFQRAIVYVTKQRGYHKSSNRVQDVAHKLKDEGVSVAWLVYEGASTKKRNEEMLRRFLKGECRLLVLTDQYSGSELAADNAHVSMIMNLDLPHESETYLRRTATVGLTKNPCHVVSFATNATQNQTALSRINDLAPLSELPKDFNPGST